MTLRESGILDQRERWAYERGRREERQRIADWLAEHGEDLRMAQPDIPPEDIYAHAIETGALEGEGA